MHTACELQLLFRRVVKAEKKQNLENVFLCHTENQPLIPLFSFEKRSLSLSLSYFLDTSERSISPPVSAFSPMAFSGQFPLATSHVALPSPSTRF